MTQRVDYRGMRPQAGYESERLRSHWEGVSDPAIARARLCENTACVDCGAEPLCGGLRCHPCFLAVSTPIKHQRRGPHPEPSVRYVDMRGVA